MSKGIYFFLLAEINVSCFIFRKMDAIHAFAREGEVDNLLKCIEGGVSVNLKGLVLFSCPFYYVNIIVGFGIDVEIL